MSNVLEWSMDETIIEAGTLSTFVIEKISFKGGESVDGRSDQFGNSTGVLDFLFCL